MKKILLISVASAFVLGWLGCSSLDKTANTKVNSRNIAGISNISDLDEAWAFDGGPNPDSPMGKELIDLVASQPNMPGISDTILGAQKFRPAFGPTLWRMIENPNSVKILFIGQDGTHIAEAAGRTATAGFGGRAQDMAAHFGVNTGAAFMNTFAYTIKKQYSVISTPIISEINGQVKVDFSTVTDNGTWLMSQDQNSPMVKWRNHLIDWIIRNNKESLKMVVLFGGSARDAIGSYIVGAGGNVGSRYSEQLLAQNNVKVPVFRAESAGSNKIYPVLQTKDGHDVNYTKLLGHAPNFETPEGQTEVQNAIKEHLGDIISNLAISDTGVAKSGIANPAQIGGYDLNKIEINGQKTISLKGLKLLDGTTIKNDIVVADFPHPTALSLMKPTSLAEQTVEKKLIPLKQFVEKNPTWEIEADEKMINKFKKGENYKYGRADIAPSYYDFGTPKNRMVSVSSASRMTGKPNVVVIGTREKAQFDMKQITAAEAAMPVTEQIDPDEMYNARPRTLKTRYIFDRGPSEAMAKIMTENIDVDSVNKNIKTNADDVGAFGHYRGLFTNSKVIILADPDGVDDILTARALTGTRGQYLQGMMNDLGVNDNYLVIKTVPFGMDGATDEEWKLVLEKTGAYRKNIFAELLQNNKPAVIIADGKYAAQELSKLALNDIPKVVIARVGSENNSGIVAAATQITALKKFNANKITGKIANIPRSHLGFFSRVWEGTSGTRVFSATSAADKGLAFAIVVPAWVSKQKNVVQSAEELKAVESLKSTMKTQSLPKNGESIKTMGHEPKDDNSNSDGKPDTSYKLFLSSSLIA